MRPCVVVVVGGCVDVEVVSVGGGGGTTVSVAGGSVDVVGGGVGRGWGRGGDGVLYAPPTDPLVVVGKDPATVPGGAVDVVVVAVCGRVNAVVVSTFVVVAEVVIVVAVSVGTVSVASPLVEPSWTTS